MTKQEKRTELRTSTMEDKSISAFERELEESMECLRKKREGESSVPVRTAADLRAEAEKLIAEAEAIEKAEAECKAEAERKVKAEAEERKAKADKLKALARDPDGVGRAYKYYDPETKSFGLTSDIWKARQISCDYRPVWVWYTAGEIDHVLSSSELEKYLP